VAFAHELTVTYINRNYYCAVPYLSFLPKDNLFFLKVYTSILPISSPDNNSLNQELGYIDAIRSEPLTLKLAGFNRGTTPRGLNEKGWASKAIC